MLDQLLQTFAATLSDVTPIVTIIFGFQFFVLRRAMPNFKKVLVGFFYVILGLSLFLMGLEKALFPLGKLMAEQLTNPVFIYGVEQTNNLTVGWLDYYWVYVFAFAIGFSTTIAEPSLLAVAMKANEVSGGSIGVSGLRVSVAIGVAIGLALGSFRIVSGIPIHYFIITGYLIVVVQTFYAPKIIVPLAYDSGGVTTSTVTVPLVAALGLGLAESVPGRSVLIDGFGLIAFASLFPIMSVMAYAKLTEYQALKKHKQDKI